VTKCIQPPKPVLGAEERAVVVSALRHAVENRRIILAAYVVMPDHWHALFGLLEGRTLPRLMHSLMSFIGAKTTAALAADGCQWQDGYYETWIRSAKQFDYVAHYVVENPVRKQLVERAELWDATSLRTPELVTEPWPWEFERGLIQ
jgi:REP element-mobilizing transposase RayT